MQKMITDVDSPIRKLEAAFAVRNRARLVQEEGENMLALLRQIANREVGEPLRQDARDILMRIEGKSAFPEWNE